MTKEQFTRLVASWGGDEEVARKLLLKPGTIRALRTGQRRITARLAAFIAMLEESEAAD